MIDLYESLFFILQSLITYDNLMGLSSIVIGIIYIYVKYRFKVVFMPSYLYEYDKDLVDEDIYDEIINTYTDSLFIITVIEGILIMMFLIQYFISPSISIEISQSGGIII